LGRAQHRSSSISIELSRPSSHCRSGAAALLAAYFVAEVVGLLARHETSKLLGFLTNSATITASFPLSKHVLTGVATRDVVMQRTLVATVLVDLLVATTGGEGKWTDEFNDFSLDR